MPGSIENNTYENNELEGRLLELSGPLFADYIFNATFVSEGHPGEGVTTAWVMAKLAQENKPDLLNKILSLSQEQFVRIDFNAGPVDANHPLQGVTLALLALDLACENKPALLNAILCLPPKKFALINFNAAPLQGGHPNQGITIAWAAAYFALLGQPSLLKKMMACLNKEQLGSIEFNVTPLVANHHLRATTMIHLLLSLPEDQLKYDTLMRLLELPKEKLSGFLFRKQSDYHDAGRLTNAFFYLKEFLASPPRAPYQAVVDVIDAFTMGRLIPLFEGEVVQKLALKLHDVALRESEARLKLSLTLAPLVSVVPQSVFRLPSIRNLFDSAILPASRDASPKRKG